MARYMVRTIFVVSITFLYIFLAGPPVILISVLTGSPRILFVAGRFGIRIAIRLGGVKLDVHGREKIDRSTPYIYVSNHQSLIDPIVIFQQVPHDAAALAKKEFFKLPILGWVCRLAGFVPVDRQSAEKRVQASNEAIRRAKEKRRSFVIFGEGTRSRDGRLGPFKKGAAIIAIAAGVDIIPIAVHGGFALWPKGRRFFRPGRVELHFLDPISTAGMTLEDKERLTGIVRARIAERLRQIDPAAIGAE